MDPTLLGHTVPAGDYLMTWTVQMTGDSFVSGMPGDQVSALSTVCEPYLQNAHGLGTEAGGPAEIERTTQQPDTYIGSTMMSEFDYDRVLTGAASWLVVKSSSTGVACQATAAAPGGSSAPPDDLLFRAQIELIKVSSIHGQPAGPITYHSESVLKADLVKRTKA